MVGGQQEGDTCVLVVDSRCLWQKPTQCCKAIILPLKFLTNSPKENKMKNTTCWGSQVNPGRTVLYWTVSTCHRADLCRARSEQAARGPREASLGGQPHCTPSLALISAQCGAHSSRMALGSPSMLQATGQVLLPTSSSSGGGHQDRLRHLRAGGLSLHGQR